MSNFNNSCCCFPSSETPCHSATCPDDKNCLRASHIVIDEQDNNSIYCDEAGMMLWSDTLVSTTICTGTPTFTIISHSENLENVTVNETQINFKSKAGITDRIGKITYQISCDNLYSTQGTITILIKSRCHGVVCAEGETCNDCTGLCEPGLPDLSTTDSVSGIDLSTTP